MRNFNALSLTLERSLQPFRGVKVERPERGWARSIREVIGMTRAQLAARLNVSISAISTLERSEEKGVITIGSLHRLAEGLECELVYALVPKKGRTLDEIVRERAESIVNPGIARGLRTALLTIVTARARRGLWR